MDGKKLVVFRDEGDFHFLDVHPLPSAAVTLRALAAGAIDEDAPHRFGRGAKEMRAVLPGMLLGAGQPQPCFMHQRGGLQRVPARLVRHLARGQLAKFFVNEREQLIGGSGIA